MRPKERRETGQTDLFRARLDQIVDLQHPLAKLARTIDWVFLETRFGAVYRDGPGQSERRMGRNHLGPSAPATVHQRRAGGRRLRLPHPHPLAGAFVDHCPGTPRTSSGLLITPSARLIGFLHGRLLRGLA